MTYFYDFKVNMCIALIRNIFQSSGNIPNFCEVGLKISGVAPISSQAAIQFPNTSISSVTVATTERHTVAFLGTTEGSIKKVSSSEPSIIFKATFKIPLSPGHQSVD